MGVHVCERALFITYVCARVCMTKHVGVPVCACVCPQPSPAVLAWPLLVPVGRGLCGLSHGAAGSGLWSGRAPTLALPAGLPPPPPLRAPGDLVGYPGEATGFLSGRSFLLLP